MKSFLKLMLLTPVNVVPNISVLKSVVVVTLIGFNVGPTCLKI